jgi:DNA polymerase-3 subunit epsilon
MEDFIAIDFETANRDRRSACAIGVAQVVRDNITRTYESLIKPSAEFEKFDPFNVLIHGITNSQIQDSPYFPAIWSKLQTMNSKNELPYVCHNAGFDMKVLRDLLNFYEIETYTIYFYDTLLVSKLIWPDLPNYKLSTLCKFLEIKLNHHDALSDAKACAIIALKHMEKTGATSLEAVAHSFGLTLGILTKIKIPINNVDIVYEIKNQFKSDLSISKITDENVYNQKTATFYQDLVGKNVVFTGELSSMSRRNATLIAIQNGAKVTSSITTKTNILIVGMVDFRNYLNGKKSRKLNDAEKLRSLGTKIDIIDEEDFIGLLLD